MLIFNILWELRERNNKFSLGMKLSQLVEKVSIEEGWMSTRKRKGTQDTGATWNYKETHHTQEMITDHSWVGVEIGKA